MKNKLIRVNYIQVDEGRKYVSPNVIMRKIETGLDYCLNCYNERDNEEEIWTSDIQGETVIVGGKVIVIPKTKMGD